MAKGWEGEQECGGLAIPPFSQRARKGQGREDQGGRRYKCWREAGRIV